MFRIAIPVLCLLVTMCPVTSQGATDDAQRDEGLPSIADKTAGMTRHAGFLDFYWDAKKETLWLEIDRWDTEFLYVTSTPSSVSGRNRGGLGRTRVVRFSRAGSKVFLTQSNYSYRALSDDPLERRAVEEAYTPAIIASFAAAAEQDAHVLVDATGFFMRSAGQGRSFGGGTPGVERGAGQGSVDKSRSAFYWPRTKNFPKNTEVEVTLTTSAGGGTTVRQHHSLVQLPDDQYRPRRYDPRAGASSMSFLDYASPFSEPINKRFIARHRLQKRDPTAAVSEPIEPIVYHVDPGAPEPIRSALVEGASWWNEAFEAIGFKDAFRVEVLPADADPMDLRYNVILWVHRPTRGWSSGSSVRDPRTGEIIAGRVFLGSQRVRQDFLIGSGLIAAYQGSEPRTERIEAMVLARTRQLAAHEVGHTLGYGHNFAASTQGRASVMDYPHPLIHVTEDGALDLSDAYDVGIGEWDKVGVAYSYSEFPPGTDEDAALDGILNAAHDRGLFFLGTVGSGSASPQTTQWDNGPDALAEFERVMRIREIALATFSENNIPRGAPMASLENVLVPIYLFHRYQTEAVSKALGGIDYRFAVRGDGQLTWEIVAPNIQRRALGALLATLKPETLAIPRRILKLIPPRPGRGDGETFPQRTAPAFDPLAAAETAANHTLGYLLNSSRAARLVTNHALDPRNPSLAEVIDQLLARTWLAQRTDPYLAEVGRTVDGVALQHLLELAADTRAPTQVRAIASLEISKLDRLLAMMMGGELDDSQQAHLHFAREQIAAFHNEPSRFQRTTPAAVPAGAPIGMGEVALPGMECGWR